ncbi:hypothetical protein KC349_g8496 [Hortaea werneckii]|nr:hypothetical protein KC349_g8496 [Hortaea werneckii]
MSQENVPSLEEALRNCFETGEYADMTITCGSRVWRVHKVVVCSRVPFFAKAVAGKFKVRHLCKKHLILLLTLHQEARDSCIDLMDDDPGAVDAMLRWLYCGTFHQQLDVGEVLFLARCYNIADKYLIADFRTTAGQELRKALIACKWDVKDLLALIEELFAGANEPSKAAPELLRTWAIAATYLNYPVCFHSSPSHIRFREVAFSRPDLLMGVMDIFRAKNPHHGGSLPDLYRLFPLEP